MDLQSSSNLTLELSMKSIGSLTLAVLREEDGASASEYAVLVALVVVAVAAAVSAFNLEDIYETVSGKVINCVNSTAGNC
jgi:Flp pilus assembly pilin Flp